MSADNELEQLRAEVERLHSWAGLLSLLDEHWPEDIFPTEPDSETRNPGRIVSLLRWVERLRAELAETVAAHMAYRQQTAALKSAVEEVLSDPIMHSPLGEPLVRVADVLAALAAPETPGSKS